MGGAGGVKGQDSVVRDQPTRGQVQGRTPAGEERGAARNSAVLGPSLDAPSRVTSSKWFLFSAARGLISNMRDGTG